jgi:hypothetical protein
MHLKTEFMKTLIISKNQQLFELIETLDQSKNKQITERNNWIKDYESLINLELIPTTWSEVLKTQLHYVLPSGKTFKQFIKDTHTTYLNKIKEMKEMNAEQKQPKNNPQYLWEYGCWRKLLNLVANREYRSIDLEESDKLSALAYKE